MHLVVFTKHLQGLDVAGLIDALKSVGAEGADLCVRPGYPVEPETAGEKLPAVVKEFREAGLRIPLVTTPGDFVDPAKPLVERTLAACGQAGVPLVKLGYWYMENDGYWATVTRIRKALQQFARLAEKHRVRVLIHNHSGTTMGLNASSVMNLLQGFDPRHVGVFADPGHLSLVGEPLPMALDIVQEYLAAVAVKDIVRERVVADGQRTWKLRVVPLGEGYVDWAALVECLRKVQFDGTISMHSEYSGYDVPTVLDQTRMDIRFFRKVLAGRP